jgi:alpha(1,3/1,4) fucosyltransferase
MKKIKIDFVDFWQGFNKTRNFIYSILQNNFDVEIVDKPEYLFYSTYGWNHLQYDCIKIFYTAENDVPDFNFCDYAIGMNYMSFQDRYIRIPLCFIRKEYKKLININTIDNKTALERKFCNYVYSNNRHAHPIREQFFSLLSSYKKIESGGMSLNNIGYRVADKMEFISQYKFTIAFENSAADGYTTEKIIQPMASNSIPIYWGNPLIYLDFNVESFVWLSDISEKKIRETIEYIRFLDSDDMAYLKMLNSPWQLPGQYVEYEQLMLEFIKNIILQPYHLAFRRTKYGRTEINTDRLRYQISNQKARRRIFAKIKRLWAVIRKSLRKK